MSTIANADGLVSPFAWFLEKGTVVDATTIAYNAKPDGVPLSNWSGGSLGGIAECKFGNKVKDQPFMAGTASGAWEEVPRKTVLQYFVTLKCRMMGEYVRRLEHGVANKIVLGVAQTPGTVANPMIEGWLKCQLIREATGTLEIFDWWCQMSLETSNVFNENYITPSLRFTLLRQVNGDPVTLNTVVWPEMGA